MKNDMAISGKSKIFRFLALVIAGALLNIGFYFILFILTPLLSGAIIGFLIGKRKEAPIAGFLSSMISFLPLQLYLAPFLLLENPVSDFVAFYLALILYVLILSVFGLIGGLIGSFTASVKKNQVSTTTRPGV